MVWKKNQRETIFDLKENELDICIHKIVGLEGWFLSCNKLGISQKTLKAEDFNEAVRESQIIVIETASKLYHLAGEFAKNVYDNNEFVNY